MSVIVNRPLWLAVIMMLVNWLFPYPSEATQPRRAPRGRYSLALDVSMKYGFNAVNWSAI